ncbi:MAG: hypothetical protein NTY65_04375 [Planctomycetota bacterium]|nr:hypothetical protein [Planctomycetota bacterium]
MSIGTRLRKEWSVVQAYLRGWRTPHRILVIESDDWGSIRASSREAYDRLVAAGYPMGRSAFGADALETDEDLDRLFNVLGSVRDASGRPACMTANMVMANPDFDRIRQHDFRYYFHEPACLTLARSAERQGVTRRWSEGAERQVFVPQLHAREHVCWWKWLTALRAGSVEARLTFDLGMCGVPRDASKEGQGFYSPVYLDDAELERQGVDLAAMVKEGAALFEKQFGHRSLTAIAPNYCWTCHVEHLWAEVGVRFVQGATLQDVGSVLHQRCHYLGQRTATGGWYLVRNCLLEPSGANGEGAADCCLRQVACAFRMHQPAIVSSHRVNYVGSIIPSNRARGLRQLRRLLDAICRRWPDVLFMSSPELGCLIAGQRGASDNGQGEAQRAAGSPPGGHR